ncbi:helix-turn-helix domain-containing protein [Nocardia aobensis]|uniref:helix-turn-helix domain-containing protein n=1 Tax=Nocardia aobensis TaxID=257277 RepID=UPI0002EE1CE8|nr:helix-turn-helix transcriptional regulator [Nocardia aobensis]
MDSEYRWEEESSATAETPAERIESWHHYLRSRQGSVGLAFGDTVVHYRRTGRDVRGDGDDSYRLLLPLRGEFKFAQGDAAEVVAPGRLAFFHWGSPLVMRQDEPLLRTIRLERARRRLSSPLPVDMDTVAHQTGFTTTRRFREAFQRRYGRSPEQMRAELYGP